MVVPVGAVRIGRSGGADCRGRLVELDLGAGAALVASQVFAGGAEGALPFSTGTAAHGAVGVVNAGAGGVFPVPVYGDIAVVPAVGIGRRGFRGHGHRGERLQGKTPVEEVVVHKGTARSGGKADESR